MTTSERASISSLRGGLNALNGGKHRSALRIFLFITLAHWAEHLVQALQIWVLGWDRAIAGGVLGLFLPTLALQEWLHYVYAAVMLVGLLILRPAFAGRARAWWTVALAIQFWHHIEHGLLLVQGLTLDFWFGKAEPTSILQVLFPRAELHQVYNVLVLVPLIVGMYLHLHPNRRERAALTCSCKLEIVDARRLPAGRSGAGHQHQ